MSRMLRKRRLSMPLVSRREFLRHDDPKGDVGHREPDREGAEVFPVHLRGGRDGGADHDGRGFTDHDVAGAGVPSQQEVEDELRDGPFPLAEEDDRLERVPLDVPVGRDGRRFRRISFRGRRSRTAPRSVPVREDRATAAAAAGRSGGCRRGRRRRSPGSSSAGGSSVPATSASKPADPSRTKYRSFAIPRGTEIVFPSVSRERQSFRRVGEVELPGEHVPRPAGNDQQRRPGAGQPVGDLVDRPVAADGDDRLRAVRRRFPGHQDGVADPLRPEDAEIDGLSPPGTRGPARSCPLSAGPATGL